MIYTPVHAETFITANILYEGAPLTYVVRNLECPSTVLGTVTSYNFYDGNFVYQEPFGPVALMEGAVILPSKIPDLTPHLVGEFNVETSVTCSLTGEVFDSRYKYPLSVAYFE